MDSATTPGADARPAVEFTGSWREYLPIAVTNALLIICTLGVYRFWASARQRRYLWSRTVLIDDCLEWTGTGKEMFLGFLIVICVIGPFFLFIQFLFPALMARGKLDAAVGIFTLFELAIIYLFGIARFRALRYRLSRSWWHGIRGGSNDPGWNFGGEYLGRNLVSMMTLFIVFPWATVHLWNSRWNKMSFGQLQFAAGLDSDGLKLRWAMIYLAPICAVLLALIVLALVGVSGVDESNPNATASLGLMFIAIIIAIYLAIPLATLNWYAAFYRKAVAATQLGDLQFDFDASTFEWLKLILGNIALAVVTLGFGLTYWGYRNWSFMVRHLHVYGTIDIGDLEQSSTRAPLEAEGFADAFDIGAI